jgi:hypothetical protein
VDSSRRAASDSSISRLDKPGVLGESCRRRYLRGYTKGHQKQTKKGEPKHAISERRMVQKGKQKQQYKLQGDQSVSADSQAPILINE